MFFGDQIAEDKKDEDLCHSSMVDSELKLPSYSLDKIIICMNYINVVTKITQMCHNLVKSGGRQQSQHLKNDMKLKQHCNSHDVVFT